MLNLNKKNITVYEPHGHRSALLFNPIKNIRGVKGVRFKYIKLQNEFK